MSATTVCSLCGTVNVGDPIRCIACGQEFGGAPPPRRRSRPRVTEEATDELTSSARQPTVVEAVPGRLAGDDAITESVGKKEIPTGEVTQEPSTSRPSTSQPSRARQPSDSRQPSAASSSSSGPDDEPSGTQTANAEAATLDTMRYIVRVLLPDGDRRSVEIGSKRVPLGSGLDELGLTGDPRVGSSEAYLCVEGESLFIIPTVNSTSVYRRLATDELLEDGDVVLMGDVAATYRALPPGSPIDANVQVLGGSANSPLGRLIFLRRDGSDGPAHDLPAGKTIVGRTDGHLNFPKDSRLSRRHARLFATDKGVTLEDLGSRNGTYLRVRRKTQLHGGDALRVGSAGIKVRGRI